MCTFCGSEEHRARWCPFVSIIVWNGVDVYNFTRGHFCSFVSVTDKSLFREFPVRLLTRDRYFEGNSRVGAAAAMSQLIYSTKEIINIFRAAVYASQSISCPDCATHNLPHTTRPITPEIHSVP